MRAQQRYTYLGLIIVLAMGFIVAWIVWTAFYLDAPITHELPEHVALRMQCEARDGLLAFSKGAQGTDVACYQGHKKLWLVRLK